MLLRRDVSRGVSAKVDKVVLNIRTADANVRGFRFWDAWRGFVVTEGRRLSGHHNAFPGDGGLDISYSSAEVKVIGGFADEPDALRFVESPFCEKFGAVSGSESGCVFLRDVEPGRRECDGVPKRVADDEGRSERDTLSMELLPSDSVDFVQGETRRGI